MGWVFLFCFLVSIYNTFSLVSSFNETLSSESVYFTNFYFITTGTFDGRIEATRNNDNSQKYYPLIFAIVPKENQNFVFLIEV